MQGITFGEYHSYTDFNLMLAPDGINDIPPALQSNYLDVPYRNTLLDMSEAFGKLTYEKRTPSYTFNIIQGEESWEATLRRISNALHGKRMKIIYDRDAEYYLLGRVSVNSFKSDKKLGKVVLNAICDPFKYKLLPTSQTFNVNGSMDITLQNEGMTAYPLVTTTAQMRVVQGLSSFSFGILSDYQSKIELSQGINELTLIGTGSVTFTYQEGVL